MLFTPSNESPTIVAYIYDKDNISWSIVPSTLLYLANIGIYKLSTSLDKASNIENSSRKSKKSISDSNNDSFNNFSSGSNFTGGAGGGSGAF